MQYSWIPLYYHEIYFSIELVHIGLDESRSKQLLVLYVFYML